MKKQTFQLILGFFLIFSAFPVFAEFSVGSGDAGTCSQSGWMYHGRTGCVTGTACQKYGGSSGLPDPKDVICTSSAFTGYGDPTNSTCSNTSSGRICTCNVNTRQNTSIGLISTNTSCTPDYATPSNDILAFAIGAGLIGGGSAAAFATCSVGLNPVCVASLLSAAAGAGLAVSAYNGDGSPVSPSSDDPCAGKTCVTVQLDPNKPLTGTGDGVSRDTDGNFNAVGSGWTNNGDGTSSKTTTNSDGSITNTVVDTTSDRVTSETTYVDGDKMSTTIQSGNAGGGVYSISQSTDASGSNVYQSTDFYDDTAVVQDRKERSQGANVGSNPYNWSSGIGIGSSTGGGTGGGDTGGGDTGGGGTGSGTGSGDGDCATYGCAKESTQMKVLDALKGGGELDHAAASNTAVSGVSDGLADTLEGYKNQVQSSVDDVLNDSGVSEALDQLGDFNPLAFDTSECSINSVWLGHSLNLSYCDEQPTIHWILSFIFFVLFSFAIINVILEKNK